MEQPNDGMFEDIQPEDVEKDEAKQNVVTLDDILNQGSEEGTESDTNEEEFH